LLLTSIHSHLETSDQLWFVLYIHYSVQVNIVSRYLEMERAGLVPWVGGPQMLLWGFT